MPMSNCEFLVHLRMVGERERERERERMEVFSLNSLYLSVLVPCSLAQSRRRSRMVSPGSSFGGRVLRCSKGFKSYWPTPTQTVSFDLGQPGSASTSAAIGSNLCASAASRQEGETKDKVTVFVAGATGRVGSRTVRELLKLGFWVRAGARSAQRAEVLVQSVREMMHDDKAESSGMQLIEKLEIVECDLEKQENIRPAIGNASIVVCCIGANEKEVFDVTGPFRIDYRATKSLIEAATVANVDHFILVTSLGTNKIGFPAFLLNLFWGVLIWKKKAEETLVASGIPYTIVRPGGMERPTDSFKETHNLVLAKEDTYFRGLVSNLQVAELVAFIAKDRRLSYCKVIEVIAEESAPLKPMDELLRQIPSQREITGKSESGTLQHASSGFEVEIINIKVSKMGSLSPYSMYDDLKPPTSPTPTPSQTTASLKETVTEQVTEETKLASSVAISLTAPANEVTDKGPVHMVSLKDRPLSPYAAYEDLKPPSSPTMTSNSTSKVPRDKLVNASPKDSN